MANTSRQILEALRLLTSPEKSYNDTSSKESKRENQFDRLLEKKLRSLGEKLASASFIGLPSLEALQQTTSMEVCSQADIRWNFASTCLHLLLLLDKDMKETGREFDRQMKENPPSLKTPHQAPPLSPDVLSIEQEKTVLTTLQFIVCLGVCPNLDKGVGIPVERRSGFGSFLGEGSCQLEKESRYSRLAVCGRILVACLDIPSLGALILSRHLSDLLAILLQLNHGPSVHHCDAEKSEKLSENDSSCKKALRDNSSDELVDRTENSEESNMQKSLNENEVSQEQDTQTESDIVCNLDILLNGLTVKESDQEFAEESLQKVLTKVHPSLLVRDLVMLQGGPRSTAKVKTKGASLSVSPPWLRRVCGRLMTDILMRSQGLLHVLKGMLPPTAQSGVKAADTGDWKKCQAVAMVIAHCPMQTSSVEEYYKHIAPQILDILHHQDKSLSQQYLRVVVSLVKIMTQQHPDLVECHLLGPILAPLHQCVHVQETQEGADRKVIVSERELSLCIQDIHKLYVWSTESQTSLYPSVSRYIHILYTLYCSCTTGISHLRSACEDILVTFLKQAEDEVAMECLWLLATGIHGNKVMNIHICPHEVVFRSGESGGMKGVIINMDSGEGVGLETRVESLVHLVKHLQETSVAGDFFIKLLQELTEMVSTENSPSQDPAIQIAREPGQELFFLEQNDKEEAELFNRRLIILNLLASMCEELGPSCFKKTQQILAFVKTTLERGVEVCRATTEELTGLFESETLTMAMGLLTAVMGGAVQVEESDRQTMQELLPLLDEIRENHFSEEVREMADDIRIAIATRGAVWSELIKTKTNKKHKKSVPKESPKESKPGKPLIEVISESSTELQTKNAADKISQRDVSGIGSADHSDIADKKSDSTIDDATVSDKAKDLSGKVTKIKSNIDQQSSDINRIDQSTYLQYSEVGDHKGDSSELDQAFLELCDPEIPVRGHGLLRLTHLIQNKDTSALSRLETLLEVFEENLQHKDSYIYLASVNGLAALADRCPDQVVARLAREFADFESGQRKKSSELKMKLGESLMKAARSLGDMMPKYRDILLAAILSGARSSDAVVRASSLSNLAEVCRLLRFSLGSVLHEVFQCCSSVLGTDPDADSRKAAALTLTQLIQGLGSDTPQVLESVIGDLYRLLKRVHSTDQDEMVRTHALLALNELDTIMRAQLFPAQKLQKKISVLHPE